MATPHPDDPERTVSWPHGRAVLRRLGAMLAPVHFRHAGRPDFQPMHVAPWAEEPGFAALPGLLRGLRGDWPCVPFGTVERPPGLPADWAARDPGDAWGHGHAAHHEWQWCDTEDPLSLRLSVEPPGPGPLQRLVREVRAVPDAPALQLRLTIEVRQACRLPVALHPTFRLDAGPVRVECAAQRWHAYPVAAEPGVSRLRPGAAFASLARAPSTDGGTIDLSRFPLGFDTEELLQAETPQGPVGLHYEALGWTLHLDWDHSALPDAMLWISHRGRRHAPWNGRHRALGVEPLNACFDLARIAAPPHTHPLASRQGLVLNPDHPFVLRSRLWARPVAG